MSHIPNCGFWNPDCERCSTMTVGELDEEHFKELMGCTRQAFEQDCQYPWQTRMPGLYNFWYPIMEANALKIYFGASSLAGLQK